MIFIVMVGKIMLSLLINNNYNHIINTETGKWFGFYFATKNSSLVINNVNKRQLSKLFSKYYKYKQVIELFDEIAMPIETKNNLLTKLNYLVLHTTDACNMKCKYCYAKDNINDSNPNVMSSSTMIDSINKFFSDDDFFVLFHGREPLTNYHNILKTIKHFKDNNKIHFIVQTNGMLLNESIIKTLSTYNVQINISFDGFDDFSNDLRINGYTKDYTFKITNLLQKYQDIEPILILHKNNINSIDAISKKLKAQEHDFVAYNFLWPTIENKELNKYIVDNELLYNKLVEVFENSIANDGANSYFAFKERDLYLLYGRIVYRHINNYMCNKSPCGAGKICVCVNNNGDVYPCTTVNKQKENFMGNIYDNSKKEILSSDYILKHRDINHIKDCKKCPLKIFCGGGACSGLLYNYKKNINSKSFYCKYYYNMILYIMKKCINSVENDIFQNK